MILVIDACNVDFSLSSLDIVSEPFLPVIERYSKTDNPNFLALVSIVSFRLDSFILTTPLFSFKISIFSSLSSPLNLLETASLRLDIQSTHWS